MEEPRIVFEDENLIVLEKPPGWVVNRAQSAKGPIVQDWIEKNFQFIIPKYSSNNDTDFYQRSGVVHRLDKDTSGLLLVAKNEDVFTNLTKKFAEREVKKRYLALVHGRLKNKEGVIEEPVGRLPWNRERFGVFPGGREARTEYRVLAFYRSSSDLEYTLVEALPKTGRTHQIRVHFKSIGHAIVADEFYAGRKTARDDLKWCTRLFLHAHYLGFYHPISNLWVEFNSQTPIDLADSLRTLGDEIN